MAESHDSRPTVDIDHQQPEWHDNRAERWADLRERCPVVFNQHYGGFWMATDYASVSTAMRDAEGYAHKLDLEGGTESCSTASRACRGTGTSRGWGWPRTTAPATPSCGGC